MQSMTVRPGIAEKKAPIKTPRFAQRMFSKVNRSPIAGTIYSIIATHTGSFSTVCRDDVRQTVPGRVDSCT